MIHTYIVDVDRSTHPPTVTVHVAEPEIADDVVRGRTLLEGFPVRSVSDAGRLGHAIAAGLASEPESARARSDRRPTVIGRG